MTTEHHLNYVLLIEIMCLMMHVAHDALHCYLQFFPDSFFTLQYTLQE
jgi:hypothetical protein